MLCDVLLCYIMLCYVMWCYVILCYVMLCYVMLWYVTQIDQFKIIWLINVFFHTFYDHIRTLSDLAVANIIQYETSTHQIQPLTEAFIMTRHMIKFKSMVLMMKLPKDCDISLLIKELSGCEEMLKPLRRTEKVLLNGFMKIIRYPIKTKVIWEESVTVKLIFPSMIFCVYLCCSYVHKVGI